MQLLINNWSAVLTAPATASAVSLSVPLADAAKLTGLGSGDHYLLTLAAVDGAGVESAWEIVKVTASAAGVLTVQRAQEGTVARDWVSATVISARVTKSTLEALRQVGGVPPAPVITTADTARAAGITEAGHYIRWTNTAPKAYTLPPQTSVEWEADSELHGRNCAAGNLTLTPGAGVTLNAPYLGTLVVPPGGAYTLKRGAADVWDVLALTVAA